MCLYARDLPCRFGKEKGKKFQPEKHLEVLVDIATYSERAPAGK